MAYCTETVKISFFVRDASSYDRPARPFLWCRQFQQFGLHAGNMKLNTQNEVRPSIRMIMLIIVPVYLSAHDV